MNDEVNSVRPIRACLSNSASAYIRNILLFYIYKIVHGILIGAWNKQLLYIVYNKINQVQSVNNLSLEQLSSLEWISDLLTIELKF